LIHISHAILEPIPRSWNNLLGRSEHRLGTSRVFQTTIRGSYWRESCGGFFYSIWPRGDPQTGKIDVVLLERQDPEDATCKYSWDRARHLRKSCPKLIQDIISDGLGFRSIAGASAASREQKDLIHQAGNHIEAKLKESLL